MKRASFLALTLILASGHALAQAGAEVSLTRLECGTAAGPSDVGRFSDTFAYHDFKVQLTYSCYLIKHGDQYLVWDAGQPADGGPRAPKKNLVELLAEAGLKPEQVSYLGISHYHGDHIGQSPLLPDATLLIGKGDWEVLSSDPPRVNAEPLKLWISGGGKVEPVTGDKDVFGDGSVVMLDMPGHTPGHHSLLVKLKEMGTFLISGDQAHFHENYEHDRVPSFNTNRADTLASFDRFKRIAKNLNATVIIQHDVRDIEKLPPFPQAAH